MLDNKTYNINHIENAQFINQIKQFPDYLTLIDEIEELKLDLIEITNPERKGKKSTLLQAKEKELIEFKECVFQLFEIFNKIEINTDRLIIAKQYFDNGNIKKADEVLNANELGEDQTLLIKARENKYNELNDIECKLDNNANEYHIKALTTKLQFGLPNYFSIVCEYFEKALLSKRKPEILFDYAHFLSNNLPEKSLYDIYCKKPISLLYEYISIMECANNIQPDEKIFNIAKSQNCLINIFILRNDKSEIEKIIYQTLTSFEYLYKIYPDFIEQYMVDIYLNACKYFYSMKLFEKSNYYAINGMEHCTKLQTKNPIKSEINLAVFKVFLEKPDIDNNLTELVSLFNQNKNTINQLVSFDIEKNLNTLISSDDFFEVMNAFDECLNYMPEGVIPQISAMFHQIDLFNTLNELEEMILTLSENEKKELQPYLPMIEKLKKFA